VRYKRYIANAVHHSDRGVQYCSAVYQKELLANHIQPSMTVVVNKIWPLF
jgi:putative transposase